jgi:hypothetical protein
MFELPMKPFVTVKLFKTIAFYVLARKFFNRVLVEALARRALAMCLKAGFDTIKSFLSKFTT